MATPTETTADVITGLINWSKKPYQTDGSVFNWFLFVGLITACAIGWSIILNDIKGA